MTAERWARLEALFANALDRPPAERAAYLDAACAADPTLRPEVERLLSAHATGDLVLDTPPAVVAALSAPPGSADADDALAGERLGPWRIERLIGRGGMGSVFLAERADGAFNQRVAVKVLRRGLDTDDVLARFRAERQILAGLRHPHIARLIDGGTTPGGRPYFVLEYVEGVPITAYADAHAHSVEARLALFLTACEAVQAAHQALVVHRDLKPGNILVTAEGEVKLLDFGIAKLLNMEGNPGGDAAPGDADAPLTRTEVRLMTPAYAAPEQVRGEPVTTATDVYALGVLLYELLTGRRPYEVATASPVEIERIVTTQEPPRPSTVAGRRRAGGTGPDEKLRRRLSGDLDTITLKALHKDPARRYGTVAALADDLRRHLAGRPVHARPDTFAYRTRTFVRRHRVGVGLGAAALVVLVGFSAVTAMQAGRLRTQAADLTRERDRAEGVLGFLLGLFEAADPTGSRGTAVTAHELLTAGALEVEEMDAQPDVQAAMLDALGRVYLRLGAFDEAGRLAERALRLRRGLFGEDHAEVAQSLHLLGEVAAEQSRLGAADSLLTHALAMRRRLRPPGHADFASLLVDLAWVRMLRDDYAAADTLNREALALLRRGDDPLAVAEVLNHLGILRRRQSDLAAAAEMHREALALRRRHLRSPHYYVGQSLNNLAIVRQDQGLPAAAESLLTAAIPHYTHALGPDHPDVLNAVGNLASARFAQADYVGADSLFRGVLRSYRAQFGRDHRLVALTLHDLGEIQHAWGQLAEAEALFRESLAMRRRVFGDDHREVGVSLVDLALVRRDRGAVAEAEALLREALALQTRLPDADRAAANTRLRLGEVLRDDGRLDEAERQIRAACATWAAHPQPDTDRLAQGRTALQALYRDRGRPLGAAACMSTPGRGRAAGPALGARSGARPAPAPERSALRGS